MDNKKYLRCIYISDIFVYILWNNRVYIKVCVSFTIYVYIYSLIVVDVLPVPTTDSCRDLHVLQPIIPSASNPTFL